MSYKFTALDKNNLYHKIRLSIKEKELNEAAQDILFLFEDFIDNKLGHAGSEDDESGEIKPFGIKPGGTFRRVDS